MFPRSARRPASLSPTSIFHQQYLSALAKVQAARANHPSVKAGERNDETLSRFKDLSAGTTTTDRDTAGTAGTVSTTSGELSSLSDEARAIEANFSVLGETLTLPAKVDSLPSTDTETASAAKFITYPPPSRTYAAPKELGREVNGGMEHFEPANSIRARPAQPVPVSSVKDFEPVEFGIPVDLPTETAARPSIPSSFKDALPIDKDNEFTIIDHDIDVLSMPAMLVQGADVESDDVNGFILIPREAGDALFDQPNVNDGGDDWVNVVA